MSKDAFNKSDDDDDDIISATSSAACAYSFRRFSFNDVATRRVRWRQAGVPVVGYGMDRRVAWARRVAVTGSRRC